MDERDHDLVIIGGGIGGSALATVMQRAGHSCLVLEHSTEFPDRTKGEWIAPWGVVERSSTRNEWPARCITVASADRHRPRPPTR